MSRPRIGSRIKAKLDELAALSDEDIRLTRLYLSPAHRRAVDLVSRWMAEAGMAVRLDTAGSVVGRYEGASPGAKTLLLGSHIDTVRDAGKYDGPLGVATAIEVVDDLNRHGRRMPFAIEVVAFGDEEGVRFPSTLGGSRALAGCFDPHILDDVDVDGVSRRRALVKFGCDPDRIAGEARDPASILGYVEVHIEQGPVLEAKHLPVGVVTAIAGASRAAVDLKGVNGHAGTVPMAMRRDALAAAAEMIVAIEKRASAEPDLVATVGRLAVASAATNKVPGNVGFTIDIRSPRDKTRLKALADIKDAILHIATERHIGVQFESSYDAPAAACDPALSEALAKVVEHRGMPAFRLPSGAGHDAMAFRGRIPFAMLFVRCRGGVSHNPAEFASVDDMDVAAHVLADLIPALAGS